MGRSAPPGRIQEDVDCAFLGLYDEQLRQNQQQDPNLAAVEVALREEKPLGGSGPARRRRGRRPLNPSATEFVPQPADSGGREEPLEWRKRSPREPQRTEPPPTKPATSAGRVPQTPRRYLVGAAQARGANEASAICSRCHTECDRCSVLSVTTGAACPSTSDTVLIIGVGKAVLCSDVCLTNRHREGPEATWKVRLHFHGMERNTANDTPSSSVGKASNASASVHRTDRKVDSNRQVKALQSPPMTNSLMLGRRWLRPPLSSLGAAAPTNPAARGSTKMAATGGAAETTPTPKMAGPLHAAGVVAAVSSETAPKEALVVRTRHHPQPE
ncbi:unnamed protein product [Lampetra fluviatilis]